MRLAVFLARCAFALTLFAVAAPRAARAADIAAGKAIFEHTCLNCHALEVGVNKVGPSLWHVVGRPSGTVEGFAYSDAMKNLHGVWTPEALNIYLANPRGEVHGVKMFFKGLSDPQDRQNVIAYLQSLQ
jgi:cytochrome c